jgi:hypothetical protein
MSQQTQDIAIRDLDSIDRDELITLILEFRRHPPFKFRVEWLREQSTERLRLLLLAANVFEALRKRGTKLVAHPEPSLADGLHGKFVSGS